MHGTFFSPHFGAQSLHAMSGGWLARRWYYTPRTHRAYSVRQVSPGDRRPLAEFMLDVSRAVPPEENGVVRELSGLVFDRLLAPHAPGVAGLVALENTAAGDRVIGVCGYAVAGVHDNNMGIAVAQNFRDEQVGRTLLSAVLRQARRAGVERLACEIAWSNRPMLRLATTLGFAIEPVAQDRRLRRVVLALR